MHISQKCQAIALKKKWSSNLWSLIVSNIWKQNSQKEHNLLYSLLFIVVLNKYRGAPITFLENEYQIFSLRVITIMWNYVYFTK